jgi:hypothetical protein
MKCRWPLALLGLTLGVADLRAQVLIGPRAYGYGGVLNYTRVRGNGGLSVSLGGFYGPPMYAAPFYRQVTIVYTPPVIVFQDPRSFLEGVLGPSVPHLRADAGEPMVRIAPGLPGGQAGRMPQPQPDNRPRVQLPPGPRELPPPNLEARPPRPQPPPEKKPEPQPEKKPEPKPKLEPEPQPEKKPEPPRRPHKPGELPGPPLPEDDPRAESARLIGLGREAFAAGEYGRASQRFRQAATVVPKDPQAHFLLAQALFALGKYQAAVDAINAGMALQPNWPAFRFQPLEMYGANVADYPAHLRRLEDTLHRFPGDPVLLFLYAYELWFDGRKDEARALFLRARPGAADPGVIDRFLRALPAAPVL